VVIKSAAAISICDTMVLDASLSMGSGGRPMYFVWSIEPPSGVNATELRARIDSLNPAVGSMNSAPGSYYGVSTLRIEPRFLFSGTYAVSLSLKNFLGSSSVVTTVAISVLNDAYPSVRVLSGAAITTYRYAKSHDPLL
jgi:hypothetical protein